MTTEEAIKYTELLMHKAPVTFLPSMATIEYLPIVKAALEKQLPKRVERVKQVQDGFVYHELCCPKCNNILTEKARDYCTWCGQAFKWGW